MSNTETNRVLSLSLSFDLTEKYHCLMFCFRICIAGYTHSREELELTIASVNMPETPIRELDLVLQSPPRVFFE